jgi:hypothetical protein
METLIPDLKAGLDLANVNRKAHRRPLTDLSVIVPVGPDETSWPRVLGCLSNLPTQAEVVLVGTGQSPSNLEMIVRECGIHCQVHWVSASEGRARQMNEGVAVTSNSFLWFLHADSELNSSALQALDQSLESAPEAVHYFQLEFKDDGPRRMNLNTRGVRFRSRVLRLPFGDQGLCLSRETFVRLGSFNESVPYGEDHLLVWAAHRERVPLCEVNAKIVTSSRRYRESGWLLTTLWNFGRTWYQALPQWVALLWSQRR